MKTTDKEVYGVAIFEIGDTKTLKIISRKVRKIDSGIMELTAPHPGLGGRQLIPVDDPEVAYNEKGALKVFVEVNHRYIGLVEKERDRLMEDTKKEAETEIKRVEGFIKQAQEALKCEIPEQSS